MSVQRTHRGGPIKHRLPGPDYWLTREIWSKAQNCILMSNHPDSEARGSEATFLFTVLVPLSFSRRGTAEVSRLPLAKSQPCSRWAAQVARCWGISRCCFISAVQADHLTVGCAHYSFTSQRAAPNTSGHSAYTLQTNSDTLLQRAKPPWVWARGRAGNGGSSQNLQGEDLTGPTTSLSLLPTPSLTATSYHLFTYLR